MEHKIQFGNKLSGGVGNIGGHELPIMVKLIAKLIARLELMNLSIPTNCSFMLFVSNDAQH